MSSRQSDDRGRNKAIVGIFEAHEAAQKAINQYDFERQLAAAHGQDPEDVMDVTKKHIQMHTTVMNLWRRIRAIVQRDYPEFWEESIIYVDPLEAYDGDSIDVDEADAWIVGLRGLANFQGATTTETHIESDRHGRAEEVTVGEPILLPPLACRRTVLTIGELMTEAGWIKPPESRKFVYRLDETEPDHDMTVDEMMEGMMDR